MAYTTLSQLSRRWQVDRATARIALTYAEIGMSTVHKSARYCVDDILRKIEHVPDALHADIDFADQLLRADQLADRLGVTPQTVRNYGHSGRLHVVHLTKRTIRYMLPTLQNCGGEMETAASR